MPESAVLCYSTPCWNTKRQHDETYIEILLRNTSKPASSTTAHVCCGDVTVALPFRVLGDNPKSAVSGAVAVIHGSHRVKHLGICQFSGPRCGEAPVVPGSSMWCLNSLL